MDFRVVVGRRTYAEPGWGAILVLGQEPESDQQSRVVFPLRQNSCRLDRISPWGGDKGWKWQGIQRSSKVER